MTVTDLSDVRAARSRALTVVPDLPAAPALPVGFATGPVNLAVAPQPHPDLRAVPTQPTSRTASPARPDWRRVWVDERTVEMSVQGQGDPLLFLHGWGLSPRSYQRGLARIAEQRTVIAPSLPGFGNSSPLPVRNAGVHGTAAHIAATIDALGLGNLDLAAHSFGCGVSLRLAVTRPDLVRSLTLVCPVGGAASGTAPLPSMWLGLLMEATPGMTRRAAADFFPAMLRNPLHVAVSGLAARRADLLDDVRTVASAGVRVRMVFAAQDEVLRPGELPSCTPGLDVLTVPGRHGWLIARPEEFANLVLTGPSRNQEPTPAA